MIFLKSVGNTANVSSSKENLPGRGCYSCPNRDCIKNALKKERLSRAFRKNILRIPSPEELHDGTRREEVAE